MTILTYLMHSLAFSNPFVRLSEATNNLFNQTYLLSYAGYKT